MLKKYFVPGCVLFIVFGAAMHLVNHNQQVVKNSLFGPPGDSCLFELVQKTDFYQRNAQFDSSIFYARQALRACRAEKNYLMAVECDNKIGESFFRLAEYDSSLYYYNRGLARVENYSLSPNITEALIHKNLGNVYLASGQFDRVLPRYEHSTKIAHRLDPEHPLVKANWEKIGLYYLLKSHFDTAVEYLQKAARAAEDQNDQEGAGLARIYLNLSVSYIQKREHDEALFYLRKAVDLIDNQKKPVRWLYPHLYHNIAAAYGDKKNFEKSEYYFEKTISALTDIYGHEHPDIANCYNDMAMLHLENGKYQKALKNATAALQMRKKTMGPEHHTVGMDHFRIAEVYQKMGRLKDAAANYRSAESLFKSSFGPQHQFVARSLVGRAEVSLKQNLYGRTAKLLQSALEANTNPFARSQQNHFRDYFSVLDRLQTEYLIGLLAFKKYCHISHDIQDLKNAVFSCNNAFAVMKNERVRFLTEESKIHITDLFFEIFDLAVRANYLLYQKDNDKYINQLFQTVEAGKSGVLMNAVSALDIQKVAGIPDSLRQKEKHLRAELAFTQSRLSELTPGSDDRVTDQIETLEKEYFNVYSEYQSLLDLFQQQYPDYFNLMHEAPPVGLDRMKKNLKSNCVILEYFISEQTVFLFFISHNKTQVFEIPRDGQLFDQIAAFKRAIETLDRDNYLFYAELLYQKLIGPASSMLQNKDRLIVIPDGPLFYIPFDALIIPTTAGAKNTIDMSSLDYLVKEYDISYHLSATLYYKSRNYSRARKKQFFGYAPGYDRVDDKSGGKISKPVMNEILAERIKNLQPLPYSKAEVRSIHRLFRKSGHKSRVRLNHKASKANLLKDIDRADILHLATHSIIQPENPKQSAIVFAPRNGDYKDVLFSGEIVGLKLNAELVVLSSCESGVGKLVKGEGMLSLTRGFLYAGAANILISLWKVWDKSTRDLFLAFYLNVLDGRGYTHALCEAKRKLARDPNTAFPVNWSGFILIGGYD